MAHVEFTGNTQDLSTDRGYQFKFYCERCGNGYMSSFKASAIGIAASMAQAAGNMLGGIFGRVASGAYEVQRAVGGPEHDAALAAAVEEIRPLFRQCTRCGIWVCEPVCFNKRAGLCERCAPDLDEEIAAAQAEAAREQAQSKAREVDWLKGRKLDEPVTAACRACGVKIGTAKFCPECGTAVGAKATCPACSAELEGNPKFCPECGRKLV
ncbi:MAG: zinc ribbon domain-containing protein [Holophagales bacterium]|nr:MAG: zinc ribbon domain-containing protein [Holophagales bacterium]